MNEVALSELLDEMMIEEFEASESIVGKRLWTPHPQYIELFDQQLFTDAQLVECFLDTTQLWYSDPTNSLFGWREEVRAELIRCLAEDDDADEPHQLVYAEMKFYKEWVGPEGMLMEYQQNASPNP